MKHLKELLYVLIILNILISVSLVYSGFTGDTICLTGKSCENVQGSIYGNILGIKLSWIGLAAFLILFASFYFSSKNKRNLNIYLSIASLGALCSIVLISIQLFVLHELCSTCMIVDIITIIIFIFSTVYFKKHTF